jgi:hypothetical protein
MHQVVVAQGRSDELLAALGRLTSPFTELLPGQESINPLRDGEPVLVGDVHGLAYLFETGGTVFALCWGLLARLARTLDTLVIGSVYDPGEEHGEFFVARGPDVVRAYWSNPRRTTRLYALGAPLPCEADCPLSAPGGAGMAVALRAFGFPLLDAPGTALLPGERWVTWQGRALELLEADEMVEAVNAHVRAFANPAYRWPEPRVRVRWTAEESA